MNLYYVKSENTNLMVVAPDERSAEAILKRYMTGTAGRCVARELPATVAFACCGYIAWGDYVFVAVPQPTFCDECHDAVDSVIGCPDGAEVCQACFDQGAH